MAIKLTFEPPFPVLPNVADIEPFGYALQRNQDALRLSLNTFMDTGAWTALPFAANWGNYGGGYTGGAYRKDSAGRVYLRGLVTKSGGTPTTGDVVATLPAGFRIAAQELFVVHTGEPNAVGRVTVLTNGGITWDSGSTGETDYTSLSGIVFWTV